MSTNEFLPPEHLAGRRIFSDDGSSLFTFDSPGEVEKSSADMRELLPNWWTDETFLIGHMIDGDIVAVQRGKLFFIFHDSLEIAAMRMSPEAFYELASARPPSFEETVCESFYKR